MGLAVSCPMPLSTCTRIMDCIPGLLVQLMDSFQGDVRAGAVSVSLGIRKEKRHGQWQTWTNFGEVKRRSGS